jgi:hypothetical protein
MKKLIIFSGFLFLLSCKEEATYVPKGTMDKDKFIEVIKDKSLAEAALNVNAKNAEGGKMDSVYNFNVYKDNGITRNEYDSTVKYYSSRPKEFKEILEKVVEKLNEEKAKR